MSLKRKIIPALTIGSLAIGALLTSPGAALAVDASSSVALLDQFAAAVDRNSFVAAHPEIWSLLDDLAANPQPLSATETSALTTLTAPATLTIARLENGTVVQSQTMALAQPASTAGCELDCGPTPIDPLALLQQAQPDPTITSSVGVVQTGEAVDPGSTSPNVALTSGVGSVDGGTSGVKAAWQGSRSTTLRVTIENNFNVDMIKQDFGYSWSWYSDTTVRSQLPTSTGVMARYGWHYEDTTPNFMIPANGVNKDHVHSTTVANFTYTNYGCFGACNRDGHIKVNATQYYRGAITAAAHWDG